MNSNKMIVSFAPHLNDETTVNRIMRDVIIALSPVLLLSIFDFDIPSFEFFEFRSEAAAVIAVCVAACVFFEWAFQKFLKRKNTVTDLSAVITGLLLAFCLPPEIPIWMVIVGAFVAVIFVKLLFGGLGKNFANPAITARVVMLVAFSDYMTTWAAPFADASLTSKPFANADNLGLLPGMFELEMFLGIHSGYIGEAEATGVALLLGGVYLLVRRIITWHTPAAFIGTVFLLTAITGNEPMFQVFSGGLLLGAFFMATDYATSPFTNKGRLIFGAGAGLLTVLIRLYGTFPEAVSYSILLMNMVVPLINKFTVYKAFGEVQKK